MKKTLLFLLCFGVIILSGCSEGNEQAGGDQTTSGQSSGSLHTITQGLTGELENLRNSIVDEAKQIDADLQQHFGLQAIPVAWQPCDEENARYDPQSQTITFCDELLTSLAGFAQQSDPENRQDVTKNSALFFYLHELGHGYIDLLKLPITGKEEDVADQMAAYFLLSLKGDDAYQPLVDGAYSFYQFSESNPDIDDSVLSDVHSLDKQRYFNIVCWLYGATSDNELITSSGLPEERAEQCSDEYTKMKESLDILLGKN